METVKPFKVKCVIINPWLPSPLSWVEVTLRRTSHLWGGTPGGGWLHGCSSIGVIRRISLVIPKLKIIPFRLLYLYNLTCKLPLNQSESVFPIYSGISICLYQFFFNRKSNGHLPIMSHSLSMRWTHISPGARTVSISASYIILSIVRIMPFSASAAPCFSSTTRWPVNNKDNDVNNTKVLRIHAVYQTFK